MVLSIRNVRTVAFCSCVPSTGVLWGSSHNRRICRIALDNCHLEDQGCDKRCRHHIRGASERFFYAHDVGHVHRYVLPWQFLW